MFLSGRNQQHGPLRFGGKIFDKFQFIFFKKIQFCERALKFDMLSVSEENPKFFYSPKEDVLGQHETIKFKRNKHQIRDVTANCFCLCHIINSL